LQSQTYDFLKTKSQKNIIKIKTFSYSMIVIKANFGKNCFVFRNKIFYPQVD
jgi:hypothetical protein